LVLTTQSSQIEKIHAYEIGLYDDYGVPDIMSDALGFGRPLDYQPWIGFPGAIAGEWQGQTRMVANALGVEVQEVRETFDRAVTERTLEVAGSRRRTRLADAAERAWLPRGDHRHSRHRLLVRCHAARQGQGGHPKHDVGCGSDGRDGDACRQRGTVCRCGTTGSGQLRRPTADDSARRDQPCVRNLRVADMRAAVNDRASALVERNRIRQRRMRPHIQCGTAEVAA
ncbi:MAG: hypothetical protein QOJ24_277, partial [Mycobacterium sp.]|nr:hypothetical protein [Mycobacterium sp.]